jgi:hypothetical protein
VVGMFAMFWKGQVGSGVFVVVVQSRHASVWWKCIRQGQEGVNNDVLFSCKTMQQTTFVWLLFYTTHHDRHVRGKHCYHLCAKNVLQKK